MKWATYHLTVNGIPIAMILFPTKHTKEPFLMRRIMTQNASCYWKTAFLKFQKNKKETKNKKQIQSRVPRWLAVLIFVYFLFFPRNRGKNCKAYTRNIPQKKGAAGAP